MTPPVSFWCRVASLNFSAAEFRFFCTFMQLKA